MIGVVVLRTPAGLPFGGGAPRTFQRTDVAAFGKVRVWADFVVRYVVRLQDGTEVMVNASDQADDERWLRQQSRILGYEGRADRGGWAERWMEVFHP